VERPLAGVVRLGVGPRLAQFDRDRRVRHAVGQRPLLGFQAFDLTLDGRELLADGENVPGVVGPSVERAEPVALRALVLQARLQVNQPDGDVSVLVSAERTSPPARTAARNPETFPAGTRNVTAPIA